MAPRLVAVTFDVHDPAAVARFWGGMLAREVVPETRGALLPGDETQVGLRFVAADTAAAGPFRMHLHVTSASAVDQQETVEEALRLGAGHLDVGQLPEEDHVVLTDPGGNPFCVIGPGSQFLVGTGRLGEVACDGGRDVGLFWHRALDWPLVWDQNQETAVQSPAGGTKVAWGGPPETPKDGRNRQRLDLAAVDLDAEVVRLVALGATVLGDRDEGVELADPEGNEFCVAPG